MTKFLSFALLLCLTIGLNAQNLDFESWTEHTVPTLDGYMSSSTEFMTDGNLTISASEDAMTGSFSVKLETQIGEDEYPAFGYFINGDPFDMTEGHPVSLNQIDSLVGYYKANIVVGDTALIFCNPKLNGIANGGGIFRFYGIQSEWTRFAFAVNSEECDTVILAAASSNVFMEENTPIGSTIQFDDLQYKSNSEGLEPIFNHSFEDWSEFSWEDIDQWQSSNYYILGAEALPVVKSEDAYSGYYACQLTTVLDEYGDLNPGSIRYGDWGEIGPLGGLPFTQIPESFEFMYKGLMNEGDAAFVEVVFKKEGLQIGQLGYEIIGSQEEYTLFELPVELDENPDTIFIHISTGGLEGTSMILDQVEFIVPVGISEQHKIDEIVAFPIPAKNLLNFKIKSEMDTKISIYNTAGQLILTKAFEANSTATRHSLDISTLKNGAYLYKAETGGSTYSKNFIKQ